LLNFEIKTIKTKTEEAKEGRNKEKKKGEKEEKEKEAVIYLYTDKEKEIGETYLINNKEKKRLEICIGKDDINREDVRKASVNGLWLCQHLKVSEVKLEIDEKIKDKSMVVNAFVEGLILAAFSQNLGSIINEMGKKERERVEGEGKESKEKKEEERKFYMSHFLMKN